MSDFFAADEFEDGFDTDTGKPGIATVANAIQFWSTQNYDSESQSCPTVRETAAAFRMTEQDFRTAVKWHPWMLLVGDDDDPAQTIEHDGE